MFERLVESDSKQRPAAKAGVFAVTAHAAILGLALSNSGVEVRDVPLIPKTPVVFYTAPVTHTPSNAASAGQPVLPALPPLASTPTSLPRPDDPLAGMVQPSIPVPVGGLPTPSAGISLLSSVLPERGGELLSAGEVDEPVTVLYPRRPVYPPALEAARIPGQALLEFVVDTTGHTEKASLRVVSSSGPAFAEAARVAILGTRFRPALSRGRKVRQLVRQAVWFAVTP